MNRNDPLLQSIQKTLEYFENRVCEMPLNKQDRSLVNTELSKIFDSLDIIDNTLSETFAHKENGHGKENRCRA